MSMHSAPANPVPTPGTPIEAKPPALPMLLRSTLMLEAIVVFFAALVAHGLRLAHLGAIWAVAGAVMVLLIGLSRNMKSQRMIIIASAAQVLIVAIGIAIPMMFLVGAVFVVLWVSSVYFGKKIDRERIQWDQEHPDLAPNVT